MLLLEPAVTGVGDGSLGLLQAEEPLVIEFPGRNDLLWYDSLGDTLE
jgi:hypothetical protein